MRTIDFANSCVTFFGVRGHLGTSRNNDARLQVDAACTVADEQSGTSETFYLVAPCLGETMYLDTNLFNVPTYDWRSIWGESEFLGISRGDKRTYALSRDKFDDFRRDIRTLDNMRPLVEDAQVVKATLDNLPLVARTELLYAESGLRAVLEYPVKTMNVQKDPPRFQVDTGPLIVPDFDSTTGHVIERLQLAYVIYNVRDKAEFMLRRPRPVQTGDRPVLTTRYSEAHVLPARNEIFTVI